MKEKIDREKAELEKASAPEVPDVSQPQPPASPTSSGIESKPSFQEDTATSIDAEIVEAETTESISQGMSETIDSEPMQVDDVETIKEVLNEQEPEPEPVVEIQAENEPEVVVDLVREEEVKIVEKEEELSPFEELIRVASLLNPKQFELPMEMTQPFPFPGTERVDQIKNGRRVKNKRLIELDSSGCVPLPAKMCFSCNKSCKRAPLVSCDYCSLFYHQDCLNPPMTALPAGRWMCPNHPQNFIVSTAKRYTRRI